MPSAFRCLLSRLGLLFVAGVALLLPGAPTQQLAGLPLSAIGLVAAAGLVYAAWALPPLGWRTARWLTLGCVIVGGLKVGAALTTPPLGLAATYWARATPDGAPERSTDYLSLRGATRIDSALDLRGEGFAAHFFNDAGRFNFGPDVQPGRDQLPFSVRWQGFLLAPSDGDRRFVLDATGPASVALDGVPLTAGPSEVTVPLGAGLHAIQVDYTRPEARVPMLHLSWQRTPGGPLETVGGGDVRWQATPPAASPGDPAGPGDLGRDASLSRTLGWAADITLAGTVGVWLGLGLLQARRANKLWRAALGAVPLVFLGHGLLLQAPLAGRTTILSGLDDWLIYESSARDILLNGPLMDGGQGRAAPFYGQPLYPYVLALAHRLTGESLFGPLALQFAALGGVLVGCALLARQAFGPRRAALAALASLWLLVELEGEHFKVARQLFNENLYMPLVMASLVVLVGLARRRQPVEWWRALLVGGLLGLTAISRSQFLLWVPCGLVVLLLAWRGASARALLVVLLMVGGVVLVIAPVTTRNWLVSGQVVPISNSGGASLLEFHRPPPGLIDTAALQRDPFYDALHLDQQTRTVVAFARADPVGYARTLLPPAAHSIGLQGRNDPGIYWPLLLTCLLYVASFGLARTRRLHVWPIHAFVVTHLLVLMLFEADTYGYRLVMPMYAPMVAVAAQVPLAGLRAAFSRLRPERVDVRAGRFAAAGWALVAALALVLQARGLVEVWPLREVSLHGLGGQAAQAALTADQVGADSIFVASIDGTPRRFGAGSLPGLRYPWFKWFDPSHSLPLPASSARAVYALSELTGHSLPGDLVACLGQPDERSQVVLNGAQAHQQCVGAWPPTTALDGGAGLTFDGTARIEALLTPQSAVAGDTLETRLLWQPLVAHPEAEQVSLQLDDPRVGDGPQSGNGTIELYAASQWDPTQPVLTRVPLTTDPAAIPQPYRLTLGLSPTRPSAPPATAAWQGARTDRVPVSTITLSPGSGGPGQALPADMKPVDGPPVAGGGLELIGARPLPADAAIGSPLRIGLLWRATRDRPDVTQFKLRLVRSTGEVIQDVLVPVFGGRLAPDALRAGNVVRDEETLVVDPRVPSEPVGVEVELLGSGGRVGQVMMTGRAHVFDPGLAVSPEATFGAGDAMQLLQAQLEPPQVRSGGKLTVKLRWRSGATLKQGYKVFVHVLDPAGEHVVAQRDAEPQDGAAPTTGWVEGELIDDAYAISLPPGLVAGDYQLEVGVYDAKSGDRLLLPDGDSRFVLSTRLQVS